MSVRSVTRNLVEYTYGNQCMPTQSCSFKQMNIDTILCLPDCKVDIESILKIASEVKIDYTRVIHTPKGKSLEGNTLTGKKIIVEGHVEQKVQYVACEEAQSIHITSFSTPFMTYIVLPADYICCGEMIASGFVEDVTAQLESCRQIYMNMTLFVAAEIC
ncbi:MAG: DUF3794 domain-containing protein [Cellulosilyticaceae bacterium]